jgi:hypothetical protein
MIMAITRINNNQITDSVAGNLFLGVNAAVKIQDFSVTAGKIANNLTYGSDLTITGNLTVQGNTTAIDTVNLVVEDPLILLAKEQTGAPALDIGFIGKRGTEDNIAFVWDESADQFVAVFTTSEVTNSVININSYASLQVLDLTAANANITGNVTFSGNIVGNLTVTGNVDANNFNATSAVTAGTTITATGNVSGGNLTTGGVVQATGNVSGGNVTTAGLISATGNVTGGNITTGGAVTATGNITGGNLITAGDMSSATIHTTGNALIGGNLIVQGNITYINIDDLRVEDPIIIMGTGANGAAPSADDGQDRGIFMEYYSTAWANAFVGWDRSANSIFAATSVNFSANNVVNVLEYGPFTAGNANLQSANVSGNVDGANVNATSGITAGTTVIATGNVTGGNITTAGVVEATGNVIGGNIVTTGTADLGNIRITGNDVTNFASNIITINAAASDIDVRISGDTKANLLLTDAGTDTVVVGGGNATTGAALKVDTNDSMMVPVGNTIQRPVAPEIGMFRFNTGGDALEVYASTGWEDVGVPAFTVITADAFVGNGVQTVFTLSVDSTTAGTIVAINGIVQEPTTAYAVAGNVLTFTEAPAVSDAVDARILTTTTTVTNIENVSGNAVVEVLESADTVQITGNLLPLTSNVYNLGSGSKRWNELFLEGSTITLGNVVIKNTSGNTIGFFGPDGTTAGAIDTNNIDSAGISNGTSSVQVITSGGNIRANVGGSTIQLLSSDGANVTGFVTATGNITGGNLITAGLVSLASITKTGSNGVGNIGSSTSAFDTVFAKATSAQYADLAEMYEADTVYAPGTVLCFGGLREVTLCDQTDCTRVAGVVSTNPSYLMNSGQTGEHVAAVALTGRVPCRVTGTIRKGDLIVSTGDGRGRANNVAAVGTVIGKALADFDGADGVIEVVVGRV